MAASQPPWSLPLLLECSFSPCCCTAWHRRLSPRPLWLHAMQRPGHPTHARLPAPGGTLLQCDVTAVNVLSLSRPHPPSPLNFSPHPSPYHCPNLYRTITRSFRHLLQSNHRSATPALPAPSVTQLRSCLHKSVPTFACCKLQLVTPAAAVRRDKAGGLACDACYQSIRDGAEGCASIGQDGSQACKTGCG